MKNRIFGTITLLLFVVVFYSCSNDEDSQVQIDEKTEIVSLSERYTIAKEIAVFHSQGLKFAFDKLKTIKEKDGLNLSKNFLRNSDNKRSLISDLVSEFISQELVSSDLSQFDGFEFVHNQGNSFLKSDNEELVKISLFFDQTIENISDLSKHEIEILFESVIFSDELSCFSEAGQNTLLLTFAIFIDSANYWEGHLLEWQNSLMNTQGSAQLRGWNWGKFWDRVLECAVADAKGGAIWGVAGGLGGAAVGSLAGGVGAGPGAAAGAIGGAVSGAVGYSLDEALSDVSEYWEEDDNTTEEDENTTSEDVD